MIPRQWFSAIFLVLLVAGSGWMLYQLGRSSSTSDDEPRHDPDFYMKGFTVVTMDAEGRPGRELRGERVLHYPDTDTSELLRPHMVIHRDKRRPWRVTAENGWVSAENDLVLLQGRVHIWQDKEQGGKRLEVITRDMRLLPETHYAETDRPVVIRIPSGETRSIGMRAYLDENRLELLSQVQTSYEPKKAD